MVLDLSRVVGQRSGQRSIAQPFHYSRLFFQTLTLRTQSLALTALLFGRRSFEVFAILAICRIGPLPDHSHSLDSSLLIRRHRSSARSHLDTCGLAEPYVSLIVAETSQGFQPSWWWWCGFKPERQKPWASVITQNRPLVIT